MQLVSQQFSRRNNVIFIPVFLTAVTKDGEVQTARNVKSTPRAIKVHARARGNATVILAGVEITAILVSIFHLNVWFYQPS